MPTTKYEVLTKLDSVIAYVGKAQSYGWFNTRLTAVELHKAMDRVISEPLFIV